MNLSIFSSLREIARMIGLHGATKFKHSHPSVLVSYREVKLVVCEFQHSIHPFLFKTLSNSALENAVKSTNCSNFGQNTYLDILNHSAFSKTSCFNNAQRKFHTVY